MAQHFLYCLFFLCFLMNAKAETPLSSSALHLAQSKQILLVLTPSWTAVKGKMQRYQRTTLASPWQLVGDTMPVVVGQGGMGWGIEYKAGLMQGPRKREGDGRTPVGVFALGPIFGFDKEPPKAMKLNYLSLSRSSVCVDDIQSAFYNQLLDYSTMTRPAWHSAEEMRRVPQYRSGALIQYNQPQPVAAAGSCIFLHIWKGPDKGTAGCVALDEASLLSSLSWLDPRQKPLIVLLPQAAYASLKKAWQLP